MNHMQQERESDVRACRGYFKGAIGIGDHGDFVGVIIQASS